MPGTHDSPSSSYCSPSGSSSGLRSVTSTTNAEAQDSASVPATNLAVITATPPAATTPLAGETVKLPRVSSARDVSSSDGSSPLARKQYANSNSPVLESSSVRSFSAPYISGPKLIPRGTTAYREKRARALTLTGAPSHLSVSPVESSVNWMRMSELRSKVSSSVAWSVNSTRCRSPPGASTPSEGEMARMSLSGCLRQSTL
mmetsp:Transcript_39787/g.118061  ORF Transcript_39787/g.118061 Transcript_39787/m.118061 type:complete len:202 (-) Transcript_39787:3756-4361(-)